MNQKQNKHYAFFVGGETAGPVTPLLAVAKLWKEQDHRLEPIFLDVRYSVASRMVPKHGFVFQTMSSGKFRRYWSIKNLFSPLLILIGIIKSLFLILNYRPLIVVGAGGYVQVPVVIAAWMMRVPTIIHQQDLVPTLSNTLVAPLVTRITTTFEKSVKDFSSGTGFEKNIGPDTKISCIGNPTEFTLPTAKELEALKSKARDIFKLENDWPTILVIGGGSGAKGLNVALSHNLPELLKIAQVIHSSGRGKMVSPQLDSPALHDRYHQFEFIDHMKEAYAIADVVIARAGIGTLTEVSAMGKVCIIVPMPNSHQEVNAKYLYEQNAAIILDQMDITPAIFTKVVRKILFDVNIQQEAQAKIQYIMPKDSAAKMLEIIYELV